MNINCEPLKELVRTVPDFPKPGILFYDITTLLKDKTGFAQLIDALARALHRQGDRSGAGHRGARLHLRARAGLPAERRLCAGAQAEKLPAESGARQLRPGVRRRRAGDSDGVKPKAEF